MSAPHSVGKFCGDLASSATCNVKDRESALPELHARQYLTMYFGRLSMRLALQRQQHNRRNSCRPLGTNTEIGDKKAKPRHPNTFPRPKKRTYKTPKYN
eukprot:2275640-Amphidinium_carterae.1